MARDPLDRIPVRERTAMDYVYAAVASNAGRGLTPQEALVLAMDTARADREAVEEANRIELSRLETMGAHRCPTCSLWHGFELPR